MVKVTTTVRRKGTDSEIRLVSGPGISHMMEPQPFRPRIDTLAVRNSSLDAVLFTERHV